MAMEKRTINLIIGVFLAIVAILIIHNHLKEQQAVIARLIEEGRAVEVVVATTDIPRETTITRDMIRTRVVNRNALQSGDLTSPQSAIGQFTTTDILRDQHLNRNMIRAVGLARYLSQAVPEGMRAMTIPVDKISAIEGLIKPGDRVDILGTFDVPVGNGQRQRVVVTLFKNTRVLAVNRQISTYEVPGAANTITLSLKPTDIELLTYAIDFGSLRLVLRPPGDTDIEYGYTAVTFETLLRELGLWRPQEPAPRPSTIDVYRGTDMEEAPVH